MLFSPCFLRSPLSFCRGSDKDFAIPDDLDIKRALGLLRIKDRINRRNLGRTSMAISTLMLAAFFASAQLMSLDARDMDLRDFFRLIADIGKVNVVLHPAVQGKVNMMVKDAPWEQ